MRPAGCRSALVRTALPLTLAIVGAVVTACVAEGSAQTLRAPAGRASANDTASVTRLLRVVRGVDPLLCELVTRTADGRGWWSGSIDDAALEMDSGAVALVRWIHRPHDDPSVVPVLRTAMRDPDRCVRRVAASLLARVQHPSAIAGLVAALSDDQAETRQVAAIALGLAGGAHVQATAPLIARLRDDAASVRMAAAWALGETEAQAAVLPLIDLLAQDPDPRVRRTAAWALGNLK